VGKWESGIASVRRSAACGGVAALVLAGCARGNVSHRDAPQPDSAVSVGYGTQARKNTTGAVTSVIPTEADAHFSRMEEMLRARVPGLEVGHRPNGDITLRVRGQRGLTGDAREDEPLLVIDDVQIPTGSLASALTALAPRDVERIDVLKDAASTAIYGTRGANGVIIITTKRSR